MDDSGGALEELWNHMEAAQEVVFHIQPFPESGLYRLQLKGFVLGLIPAASHSQSFSICKDCGNLLESFTTYREYCIICMHV